MTLGFYSSLFTLIYAWKKRKPWGLVSPFVRGLQTLVIVGGIAGYGHAFPWVAALLTAVRNLLGDVRDATEDADAKIYTWPAKWKWKSQPLAHLLGIYGTTMTWWLFVDGVQVWLLASILIIETATYWRTPRPSNENANLSVRGKILLYHGRWGGR